MVELHSSKFRVITTFFFLGGGGVSEYLGNLRYLAPCSHVLIPFSFLIIRLEKRELVCMFLVHLVVCLACDTVCRFLFLLESGVGCGL